MSNIYGVTDLIGGGSGALDAIAVAGLSDGDIAYGMVSGLYHPYTYVAASTESEVSPYFIIPDDNASGTGVWVLGGFQGAMSHVRANRSTVLSIPDTTDTTMIFTTEVEDTLSEYNATTGEFTAKYTGYYNVCAAVLSESASWSINLAWGCVLYIDSTLTLQGFRNYAQAATTHFKHANLSATVYVVAGEKITVKVSHNQGAAVNTLASAEYNWLTIDRIA